MQALRQTARFDQILKRYIHHYAKVVYDKTFSCIRESCIRLRLTSIIIRIKFPLGNDMCATGKSNSSVQLYDNATTVCHLSCHLVGKLKVLLEPVDFNVTEDDNPVRRLSYL